ncbi:MAG: hypothetical protein WCF95_00355 [bacterium]
MQLLSVLNNTLKIHYNPEENDLFIGDMLEFIIPSNHGVIAQIFKLEMDEGQNIAHLRIFFTIKNGNWIKWVGNIPPKSSTIKKISGQEVLELFSQLDKNSLSIGFLPQFDRNFRINIDSIDNTFVLFDNNQNKIDIFENLKNEFVKAALPFVIFDFHGEFKSKTIPRINAIKDFKIPLNIETLLSLYEKNFQYASPEMKLLFDDVIAQIKIFFKQSDEVFIPFNIFKSVVDNAQPSIELSLLKNILEKYKEKQLFANMKSDFVRLRSIFKKHTAYVVDLSKVPQEWQKDYIIFVISNLNKFFVLLEDNKAFKNSKEIDEVFENNKRVKFIGAVNYSSELIGEFVKKAKSLILCPPNKRINYFPNLVEYLTLLSSDEYIYQGEQTKYIPIILQPPVEKEAPKSFAKPAATKSAEEIKKPKEELIFQKNQVAEIEDIISEIEDIQSQETELPEEMIEFEEITLDDIESLEDLEELSENSYEDYSDLIEDYEVIEFQEDEKDEDLFDEKLLEDVESLYRATPQAQPEMKNSEIQRMREHQEEVDKFEQEILEIKQPQKQQPKPIYDKQEELKEYKVPVKEKKNKGLKFDKEDIISHPKYGKGVIKRIVSHGERNLYKIQFEDNGIKLIDLDASGVEKV